MHKGHFGDESFKAINRTGTDKQKLQLKKKYKNAQKAHTI